jgi:hypothetical protein
MKISVSFTGVISTGEFENERPLFALEDEFNGDDNGMIKRQEEMYGFCRNLFDKVQRESVTKKLEKIRKDLRFYPRNNEQYPSVTSVIGWDSDYFVSEEDLLQYAAQGEINHLKLNYFIEKKEWFEAKKIPEAHFHIVILKKGNLRLPEDSGNLPAFIEKYPISFIDSEKVVFNDEHKYAGRRDAYGSIILNEEWNKLKVKDVPTLFDLKRHKDDIKNFKQMAAYAKASPEKIEQLVIIPINDDTKQGFSKPTITQDIDAYFKMFLQDRNQFKKRFGI